MSGTQSCKRCRTENAVIVSRKEPFCPGCFRKFISLKQRKQMMSDLYFQDIFKVMYEDKVKSAETAERMNAESRILVPLSFGSSSLVMLDVLNDTIEEQLKMHRGKTGFNIDIVVCYLGSSEEKTYKEKIRALLSTRFPKTKNLYKVHVVDIETFYNSSKRMRVHLEDTSYIVRKLDETSDDTATQHTFNDLLDRCVNRSAREDLLNVMKTSVIKQFALQGQYKAILWGHSMTRLADEIMASVVKGRAAQIANALDNESFDAEYDEAFKNLHPMRDVLLSEIDAYCHISDLLPHVYQYCPQQTLLTEKSPQGERLNPKPVRNMTINELARQYFDNIEGNYSNVISTVVRTGAKLDNPQNTLPKMSRCEICYTRLYRNGPEWLRHITVTSSHPLESEEDQSLYSTWSTSEHGRSRDEYLRLTSEFKNNGEEVAACYGCLLILGEVKDKNMSWPKSKPDNLKDVIDSFVIDEDDE
ncbi:LAFA_0E08196g1_1 [Lachancea sp. 'fantastica']|nr:LAFA_0E08196g1_1 [Lachancea sp. 'fantastica']